MLPDPKIGCHHTGFTKKCRLLVSSGKCGRWIQIFGKHPQKDETVSEWNCVDNWIPILLIESNKEIRQSAAATESMRNETINVGGAIARGIATGMATGLERAAGLRIETQADVKKLS